MDFGGEMVSTRLRELVPVSRVPEEPLPGVAEVSESLMAAGLDPATPPLVGPLRSVVPLAVDLLPVLVGQAENHPTGHRRWDGLLRSILQPNECREVSPGPDHSVPRYAVRVAIPPVKFQGAEKGTDRFAEFGYGNRAAWPTVFAEARTHIGLG
jgi:hypothetical protein